MKRGELFMAFIISLLGVFGTVCFTLIAIFIGKQESKTRERISRALGQGEMTVDEDSGTLSQRVLRPLLHQFAHQLTRWAPKGKQKQTTAKLSAAGLSGQWEETEWKGLQYALSLLVSLLLFALFSLMRAEMLTRSEMGIIGFLVGYMFPNSWLKAKVKQRQKEIIKTLPDVLDLLTVSVEAGLGFDAALLKVVEKQKGVLAEEFLRVLQEIKMGRPRRETLRDLASRNKPAEDLSNVVASLVQADQLGISIGGVLRNQAKQIRQKQRQRAEEKAQKAPVKMMIPLVFFVFPSIFIIVIGPAILQIVEMFKQK
ncbi:Type II/IV secretion system protein TadC, associated with Flp pilus assembly [Desulfosporosinus metallidurans]|uniref:Type II/IV secretion system protein TadC, associated with Flp pilus assembly n=2 Tax=Desulfosporosinus metallidurans TaxID=1888891 RepID=A0A1Q8R1Y7_9FIRM|nr:Type II/IV secretion system protein TadC, associated with Flp pilus assembly [Desulfosporosinus metallidurans]